MNCLGEHLRELYYRKAVKREIIKHCKKNKRLETALKKRIRQVLKNPYQFKPLKKPLQNKRGVHVLSCYVLIYSIEKNAVILEKFGHHDEVYK